MMTGTDIEDQIRAELAARVGDDVHTEQLLARATTKGRAMRNRRRAFAVAAVTVALGVTAGVPTLWREPEPRDVAARVVTQVPAAPVVENRPVRPEEIGSDPLRFHWRFDRVPELPVSKVEWSSSTLQEGGVRSGWESADLVLGSSDEARMQVSLSNVKAFQHLGAVPSDPTDGRPYKKLAEETFPVGDSSAKLTRWGRNGQVREVNVTWTVLPGVYGYLSPPLDMPSSTVRQLVRAVRTDRVSRCAVPFRLRQLPPEAAVNSCRMTLSTVGEPARSVLELNGGSRGGIVQVQQWRSGGRPDPAHPTPTLGVPAGSRDDANREVNGTPALWAGRPGDPRSTLDDGGQLLLFVAADLTAEFYLSAGYGEDVALAMAAGYEPSRGDDPNTWPLNPVG